MTEVIKDGVNGLLVDFFDHKQISERVCEALNNKEKYKSVREQARATVLEHYDLKKCIDLQFDLIQKMANGYKPALPITGNNANLS